MFEKVDNKTKERFSANLRYCMKRYEFTIQDLANAIDVKGVTVYNWTAGETYPNDRNRLELTHIFNLANFERFTRSKRTFKLLFTIDNLFGVEEEV